MIIMEQLIEIKEKYGIWIVVSVTIEGFWYYELFDLRSKRNSEISVKENIYNEPKE